MDIRSNTVTNHPNLDIRQTIKSLLRTKKHLINQTKKDERWAVKLKPEIDAIKFAVDFDLQDLSFARTAKSI